MKSVTIRYQIQTGLRPPYWWVPAHHDGATWAKIIKEYPELEIEKR